MTQQAWLSRLKSQVDALHGEALRQIEQQGNGNLYRLVLELKVLVSQAYAR